MHRPRTAGRDCLTAAEGPGLTRRTASHRPKCFLHLNESKNKMSLALGDMAVTHGGDRHAVSVSRADSIRQRAVCQEDRVTQAPGRALMQHGHVGWASTRLGHRQGLPLGHMPTHPSVCPVETHTSPGQPLPCWGPGASLEGLPAADGAPAGGCGAPTGECGAHWPGSLLPAAGGLFTCADMHTCTGTHIHTYADMHHHTGPRIHVPTRTCVHWLILSSFSAQEDSSVPSSPALPVPAWECGPGCGHPQDRRPSKIWP